MKKNTNIDEKEKWINEVMNSTTDMQPALPPIDLYEKITLRLNKPEKVRTIALPVKQWAAAAILLLTINIGSIIYSMEHNKKTLKTNTTSSPIAIEMQLESIYNY